MINPTCVELYIDGVQVKTPKLEGLDISENKMWSANTGRLETTGEMAGTITAIKSKMEISWPDMTVMDYLKIMEQVSTDTPFHELKWLDSFDEYHTLTVYFGDPTCTACYNSRKRPIVKGLKVSAIEK